MKSFERQREPPRRNANMDIGVGTGVGATVGAVVGMAMGVSGDGGCVVGLRRAARAVSSAFARTAN